MKRVKLVLVLVLAAGATTTFAAPAFGYPPFVAKARKFGAKDCTFCHVDPLGGPPWNERGQWLMDEKARRKADAIDTEWLADFKPGPAPQQPAKADEKMAGEKAPAQAEKLTVEQELLKLEREWLDAYVNHDAAAMERIEADEFTIVFPDGSISTKAQQVASLKGPKPAGPRPSFTTEETKVRLYGDVAILTGIFVDKHLENGKEVVTRARYTDVYVKKQGRWQVVASHLTSLVPPPLPPAPAATSAVKVDAKIYDAYVGEYQTPQFILTITKEGDKLFGQPPGDTKEELIPESETKFNVPAVGAKLTFVKDDKGQVTHLLINLNGQEMQAKKIK